MLTGMWTKESTESNRPSADYESAGKPSTAPVRAHPFVSPRLYEDVPLHLAEYSGEVAPSEAPVRLRFEIVFLDLASFAPLAESIEAAAEAAAAAEVVARFSEFGRQPV